MKIELLHSFIALCETRNISKCAEQLHITQQGLSRQIRALETELGVSLFERNSKGVILTREGKLLQPYFEQSYEQYRKGMDALYFAHKKQVKTLSLFVCPGIKTALGLDFFVRFQKENPEIRLDIRFASDVECEDALYNGKSDAAFLDWPQEKKDYEYLQIVYSRLVAVVNKNHLFAGRKILSLYDLKGMTVYIPDESHRKTQHFQSAYPELFQSLNLDYSANDYDSYFTLPKYFDGVGLTFHFLCGHLDSELVEVPIKEDSYVSLFYCTKKESGKGELIGVFSDYIRNNVQPIIEY